MPDYIYRVHPAIDIARVGNSGEYYIAAETWPACQLLMEVLRWGATD